MDLRKLIIDHYPALTPELQRAAAFVLENINDVALISMRTIAHNADLKPATLSRLAKKLGYEGWEALKAEFIYSLKLTRSSYASRAVRLQQNLQQESAYDAVFSTLGNSLEDTQALNQDALQRALSHYWTMLSKSTSAVFAPVSRLLGQSIMFIGSFSSG